MLLYRRPKTISVAVDGHRGRVPLLGWGNPLGTPAPPRGTARILGAIAMTAPQRRLPTTGRTPGTSFTHPGWTATTRSVAAYKPFLGHTESARTKLAQVLSTGRMSRGIDAEAFHGNGRNMLPVICVESRQAY
jgi:hypothetical protein